MVNQNDLLMYLYLYFYRGRYTQMELALQDTLIHADENYLRKCKSACAEGKDLCVSASIKQTRRYMQMEPPSADTLIYADNFYLRVSASILYFKPT